MKMKARPSKNIEDMRSPVANAIQSNIVDKNASWLPPYPDSPSQARGPFRRMVEGMKRQPETQKRSRVKRK